jgi:hypothetical protein
MPRDSSQARLEYGYALNKCGNACNRVTVVEGLLLPNDLIKGFAMKYARPLPHVQPIERFDLVIGNRDHTLNTHLTEHFASLVIPACLQVSEVRREFLFDSTSMNGMNPRRMPPKAIHSVEEF